MTPKSLGYVEDRTPIPGQADSKTNKYVVGPCTLYAVSQLTALIPLSPLYYFTVRNQHYQYTYFEANCRSMFVLELLGGRGLGACSRAGGRIVGAGGVFE